VRKSLLENDYTVVSIFVNPAQFAPHEDLASYPRTLSRDLELLSAQTVPVRNPADPNTTLIRTPSAVFHPSAEEMYPSGIVQEVPNQTGTFIEVKGYGHQMEGKTRPTFFRGVATVVTKLFNAVEPTNAYFGQKDIQQALLLRRLCQDLLLSHPDPAHLHILPIVRVGSDELALSSRNAYLTPSDRQVAGTLRAALKAGEQGWVAGLTKDECVKNAVGLVDAKKKEIQDQKLGVELKLDFININHSRTFDVLEGGSSKHTHPDPMILSGAMWVGKTRLIDNIILGNANEILG
jgi:pantoate--beta-alanine ligase